MVENGKNLRAWQVECLQKQLEYIESYVTAFETALTFGKFMVIGISYVTLLAFVTTGVAIASFVLL